MFEALTLAALSIILGALLHKIYIEGHGIKFEIPGWKFKVKSGYFFPPRLILEGENDKNEKVTLSVEKETIVLDYGKSK